MTKPKKEIHTECDGYEGKDVDLTEKLNISLKISTDNIVDFLLKTCTIKVDESVKHTLRPESTMSISESIINDLFASIINGWSTNHQMKMAIASSFIVETDLDSLTDMKSFHKSLN